jgi:hypothetical protein
LVLLALVPTAINAAPGSRVALVIANSRYKDVPLVNPETDALLVSRSLLEIGFSVDVVRDADLKLFDEALRTFSSKADGADVALIYFAGHGFALADGLKPQNYLMSTSAEITSPSDRVIRAGGIPLDEVVQSISGRARVSLLFIDACRRSPREVRGTMGRGRGFSRLAALDSLNVFVGMSTRLEDTADDGVPGTGSPFARAFAQEIKVPGVRIDDAFAEIRKLVSLETKGNQRPEAVQTDLDSPVILRPEVVGLPPVAGTPPGDEAALLWQQVKDSDNERVLHDFRARFPGTLYASLADSRLQEIRIAHEERAAWAQIEAVANAGRIRDFLRRFPKGAFAVQARTRLALLEPPPRPPKPPGTSSSPGEGKGANRTRPSKPKARPASLPIRQKVAGDRRRTVRPKPQIAVPSRATGRSSGNCFSFGAQRFCE